MMPQVAPVDFELCVVVHVHELVNKSVFHMISAEESPLAENNRTQLGCKSARACVVAGRAPDVFRRNFGSSKFEMF
jgi:hypothetical protein